MSNKGGYIIGSTLRVLVEWSYPADPTKTMDNVDIVCKFQGRKSVTIPKTEMYRDDDGNWYAYVRTEDLGVGCFYLEVTATIPDANAPDGVKVDIQRYQFDESILP
jgi:hypothetical protein